jgi:hypothetical protein
MNPSLNPWTKTLTLVAIAGLCIGLVQITKPASRALTADDGINAPIAPSLTDPRQVAALEVISYDPFTNSPRGFKVTRSGNQWLIASAFNYPVDAATKLAEAASTFVGATTDRMVTDQVTQHERLGVIDPADATNPATQGRGTRMTLRDEKGELLADLIVGNFLPEDVENPGAPNSRRYIRQATSNRVFTTNLNATFSTKLQDWVQADLLQQEPARIQKVIINRYKVDEAEGRITEPTSLTFTRRAQAATQADASLSPWLLEFQPGGKLSPEIGVKTERINDMLQAISSLRIIGVRPKPPSLAKLFAGTAESGGVTMMDQASLQSAGFFIGGQGQLVAEEGQMSIYADDGVVFSLWFGELALDEVTRDQAVDAAKQTKAADGSSLPPPPAADGRFLMITVSEDPSFLGEPPTKSARLKELEAKEAAATEAAPLSDTDKQELATARTAFDLTLKQFTDRQESGKKRRDEMAKRFADWYYVVDVKSLDRLRPTREELVPPAVDPKAPAPITPELAPAKP